MPHSGPSSASPPRLGLVAVCWLDLGAAGFFAAVAAGFCIYAALLVRAVTGVKTPAAARTAAS
jgi:hypothetical protein